MSNPITFIEISEQIALTENEIEKELVKFWELIKVQPEKWEEQSYGKEYDGFWVVAICGKRVVWYNDIEEGFNISNYHNYGEIAEYFCDEYELNQVVWQLYNIYR